MHRIVLAGLIGLCACNQPEVLDEGSLPGAHENSQHMVVSESDCTPRVPDPSCTLTSLSPAPTICIGPYLNPLRCGVDIWQPPVVTATDACGNPATVNGYNVNGPSSEVPNLSGNEVQYIAHDARIVIETKVVLKIITLDDCCTAWTLPFGGGGGTVSNPWQICHPNQFASINYYLSGNLSNYIITKDLDFSLLASFSPVGSSANPFLGTLDGHGHLLKNITYSAPSDNGPVGIIRASGTGAVIHDLKLSTVSITGNNITGALVGQATGSRLHHISGSSIAVQTKAVGGGLLGDYFGDGDASNEDMADIALDHVTVNSSANGTLIGPTVDTGVGAIVGRVSGIDTMKRVSVNNASIYWNPNGSNIAHWTHVGGLVGYSSGGLQLLDSSFDTGSVTAGATDVGGIIGQFDGNTTYGLGYIDNVRLTNIHVHGNGFTGGIAGVWGRAARPGPSSDPLLPTLTRTVFDGTVDGGAGPVGGIAGRSWSGELHRQLSIRADVTGTNYVGGLYGMASWVVGVDDVVFTGSVTSQSGSYVGLLTGAVAIPSYAPRFNRIFLSASLINWNGSAATTRYDIGNDVDPTWMTSVFYRDLGPTAWSVQNATLLPESGLANPSSFSGFDFATIWAMPTGNGWVGTPSPALRFQCGRDGIVCN